MKLMVAAAMRSFSNAKQKVCVRERESRKGKQKKMVTHTHQITKNITNIETKMHQNINTNFV